MVYLFDIDGTLLLTGGAGTRALNRVFSEHHGVSEAMRHVRSAGKTDPRIVEEIFAAHLLRAPEPEELLAVIEAYLPYLADEVSRDSNFRIMPGAPEAVEHLAACGGVHLGLATGNVRRAAQIKLERAGLWHHFTFGGFGDDHADRALLVARAIERANGFAGDGVDPDQIVVVGDTPRDVLAARACNVRVICVPTGSYDRDALAAAGPDVILDTLWELPAWHASAEKA